jgi:hypothetical protein
VKAQGRSSFLTKHFWAAASLAVLVASGGCEGCDPVPPISTPLADLFPIDGVIDFSALWNVREESLQFLDSTNLTGVKITLLRWAVINDDLDLYIALEWTDDTLNNEYTFSGPTDFDGVQLLIDNDGSGTHEAGEDKRTLIAATVGAHYMDQHLAADDETDLIGDGFGWLRYDQSRQKYQAEFRFPLQPDAREEDANITNATRINILLYDHAEPRKPAGNIAAIDLDLTDSSGWPKLAVSSVDPLSRPHIPEDLTGLVAFVSDHQDEKGEIYTFDPAAGIIFRVTTNDLYEDTVSLSHDRMMIAFHGTPDKDDFSQYEIYTVGVDGSELTQLTNNILLDGHPGWSPDDSRIAYASFRDEKASVVVMTADGEEIADLTPPEFDDNDPDWLPDGRIVFKTDRFSTLPELRIAVMDEIGGSVEQITFVPNVVDHDPLGDATHVAFERLMTGTDYATDIQALFTPWNIVEAKLDGSEERTLVGDVWVNWLPVYDPTGQYLVYLKGPGYTAAHLITREGQDLGRLIPGITRLRYIDWK